MIGRKRWLFVVPCLIVALLAASCAPGTVAPEAAPQATAPAEVPASTPPTTQAEAEAGGEEITLTMWDFPASEDYTKWWQNYIEDFEQTHSNIQVKLEVFEMEAMRTKAIAALATDTMPDIMYSQPYPSIKEAVRQGKIMKLDNIIDADALDPLAREIVSVDGDVAGVPIMIAPTLMFYNKAQFAQAGVDPKTWKDPSRPTYEEFLAACDALEKASLTPIMMGGATLFNPQMWWWSFHHRYGGFDDLTNAITGQNGGSFQSEAFLKAGQLLQDLVTRGYFIDGYNAIGEDTMYSRWVQGDGAMIYMGLWILGSLSDAPEGFEIGWFDFPSFSDGDPCCQKTTQGGVEAFWVPATSKHPEAVGEFFRAYLTPEVGRDYSEHSGYLSPVKGVVPSNVGPDSPEVYQVADWMSKNSERIFPWYDHTVPAAVNEQQFANITALVGLSMTPEEYASHLEDAANAER